MQGVVIRCPKALMYRCLRPVQSGCHVLGAGARVAGEMLQDCGTFNHLNHVQCPSQLRGMRMLASSSENLGEAAGKLGLPGL